MTVTVLAASHGTSSPSGRVAVQRLADAAAARLTAPLVLCHVDVEQPDVPAALAALPRDGRAVIVPLLLSAGYHVFVDLAGSAAAAPVPAMLTPALGPDDRLAEVMAVRLREAGYRGGESLVMAAAGSSDARAVDDCRRAGELLAARLGTTVTVGFLSAAAPSVPEAVAAVRSAAPAQRVIVAPYLLAPGYFRDLIDASGADAIAAPLLTADSTPAQLVDLVVQRASEATPVN